MRRLAVNTFLTLDGVMQAPGGPDEDPTGGFTHGGWSVRYWDDLMNQVMGESLAKPFDLLLGRKTYEIFAAHWPNVIEEERADRGGDASDIEDPAGDALNRATKYVASRTLQKVEWVNSVLLEGDVAEAVADLKAQDGPEIQVHGSANLMQTLLQRNLIDEFRLWIFPVVVGQGKRLFSGGTVPAGLRLIDAKTSSTGVVIATYEPAGAIPYGSFAFEEPTEAELERRRGLGNETG
ncbi:MAG TPA: dihydrofolate reductase family protein [Acidimicrobiia bacterium]|nr:dihydrofolate reductase family protein [Acidimicrobiia bacterium]